MDLSIFLARFIGLYLLIMSFIWLFRKNSFEEGVRDIILSKGLFALSGAMHVMVGLAIAVSHPHWELNWRGLITLLAYVAIIKGVTRLTFPEETKNLLLKSIKEGYWFWLICLFAIGAYLTYEGFTHVFFPE